MTWQVGEDDGGRERRRWRVEFKRGGDIKLDFDLGRVERRSRRAGDRNLRGSAWVFVLDL